MDKQDQLDLDTLLDVFDKAMTSDVPAVRAALKELVLAVALTTGEGREKLVDGPLRQLMLTLHRLESKINDMERRRWKEAADEKEQAKWATAAKWQPPELTTER